MTKRKPPEDRLKTGRPSLYRPEYAKQVFGISLLGATREDLARVFGVSVDTVATWIATQPEFSAAIKAGRDEADAAVVKSLYQRALGYSHDAVKIVANATTGTHCAVPYTEHYPPDTTACIFWLKNRQRAKWRDKYDQEISGGLHVTMDAKAREARIKELQAKIK